MIYDEQQRFRTSVPRSEDGREIMIDEELNTSPTQTTVPKSTGGTTIVPATGFESPDTTLLFPPKDKDQNDNSTINDFIIKQKTNEIPVKYYIFGGIALISAIIIGFVIYKMQK